jgi:hypothetical protein
MVASRCMDLLKGLGIVDRDRIVVLGRLLCMKGSAGRRGVDDMDLQDPGAALH